MACEPNNCLTLSKRQALERIRIQFFTAGDVEITSVTADRIHNASLLVKLVNQLWRREQCPTIHSEDLLMEPHSWSIEYRLTNEPIGEGDIDLEQAARQGLILRRKTAQLAFLTTSSIRVLPEGFIALPVKFWQLSRAKKKLRRTFAYARTLLANERLTVGDLCSQLSISPAQTFVDNEPATTAELLAREAGELQRRNLALSFESTDADRHARFAVAFGE